MKGIIYKYTSPSGKVYIGQTRCERTRRSRWFNINKPYAGPKINAARSKYGPTNFKYEVLLEINSENDTLDGELICVYKSIAKAAKDNEMDRNWLAKFVKGKDNHIFRGFMWKEVHDA